MRRGAVVRLAGLLTAAVLCAAPGPVAAQLDPADWVDAFLAAETRGDVEGALGLLDEGAVYEGLLVCAPGACVGRAAIGAALAAEADDGTAHRLRWAGAGGVPGAVAAGGEMRCRSLAPRRLVYTLRADVGARGISALRLAPDARDPETRDVLEGLSAVQALLDEARALGDAGPVTLGVPFP